MQIECKAIRNIDSSLPAVGSRLAGEVFHVPKHIAEHLLDIHPPMIKVVNQDPKPNGALQGGPMKAPASSSPEVQASPQKKQTTSPGHTPKASAKRSR
jgi:hypothetical protein